MKRLQVIIGIVIGLLTIGAVMINVGKYLDSRHASAEAVDKLNMAIQKVAADLEYEKNRRRYEFLQEQLSWMDRTYGPGCQRCDARQLQDYNRYLVEKNLLEKKL